MSTPHSAISIKGTKTGLQIVLDDSATLDEAIVQLASRLGATDAFFQGAKVALDVGERVVTREEWSRLESELQRKSLTLAAALAADEESRSAARSLGIPLVTESRHEMTVAERRRMRKDAEGNSEGMFIRRTLRSGQVVRYPGSVVVMGDVNAGAEIVAEGDVVVWGSLRGMVHAGASGDETASVCALHLAPTQLRLAGHIARSPGDRTRLLDGPEIASIKGGNVVVDEGMRMKRPVNLSLRTLLLLALVYALEAIGLAAAVRVFPVSWSPVYVGAIVVAAVVSGWLIALLTVNRSGRG